MSSVTYEMIALALLKQLYQIQQPLLMYDNTENTETRSFLVLTVRVEGDFFFRFLERILRTMECRSVGNGITCIFQT